MPTYKITGPDGKSYSVTGEGTYEQALESVKKQFYAGATERLTEKAGQIRGNQTSVDPVDIGRGVVSGAAKAADVVLGAPKDLYNLGQDVVGMGFSPEATQAAKDASGFKYMPGSEDVRTFREQNIGKPTPPETELGKTVEGATEWGVGGAVGKGGMAKTLRRTIAGGVGGAVYEQTKDLPDFAGGDFASYIPTLLGIGTSVGVGAAEAGTRKLVKGNKAFEKAYEKAPTFKDLKQQSRNYFNNARLKNGIIVDRGDVNTFSSTFRKTLYQDGLTPKLAPQTNRVLDELEGLANKTVTVQNKSTGLSAGFTGNLQKPATTKPVPMTFNDLLNKRNELSQIAAKTVDGKPTSDAAAAMKVLDEIDDGIANGRWATSAQGSQALQEAQGELKNAREVWRRASIAQDLENMGYKAELKGKANYTNASEDTAIRQQVLAYLSKPNRAKFLKPGERKIMEDIIKGDVYSDELRSIGKNSPSGPVPRMGNMIRGGGAGMGAHYLGADPVLAGMLGVGTWAGSNIAGKMAKGSLDRLTRQKLQSLDLMIRSGRIPPEQRQEISRRILQDALQGGVTGAAVGTRAE